MEEGSLTMAIGVVTVVGYMIVLGIVGLTIMYYLTKAMITHDSVNIDPIPEKRH